MAEDLKKMYRTIMDDHFPPKMEISFVDENNRQTLFLKMLYHKIVLHGLILEYNPGPISATILS